LYWSQRYTHTINLGDTFMQSKTQAQKREDREKRLAEQEASRQAIRNAHLAAIQEQLQKQKQESPPIVALSKKEQRKQKKAAAEQIHTNERSVTDKLANLTITTVAVEDQHQTDGTPLQGNTKTKVADMQTPSMVVNIQHTNSRETEDRASSTVVYFKEMAQIAVRNEVASESHSSARIVYNHSTHCPGLRPVLIRLQKYLPGATITPGKIASVANNAEEFELRFQRAESEGGYKFVARHGFTA